MKRETLENNKDIAGDESVGDVDFLDDTYTQSILKKKWRDARFGTTGQ